MFRFALIAYLSLTTVFRPALCCCMAKDLFSSNTCCKSTEALTPVASPHEHKSHKNCRGHGKSSRQASNPYQQTRSEQSPKPCDHGGQKCPCEKSYASMDCMAPPNIQVGLFESQTNNLSQLFDVQSYAKLSDVHQTLFIQHYWESELYGREMLRAYQIMRC